MNRLLYYLLALLLAAASTPATAQQVAMTQSLHYSSGIGNVRVATDAAGYSYYAGCFEGQIDIAGTRISAPAGNTSVNIFFAKFTPGGQLVWLTQGGSPTHEIVYDVTTDGAGSVYVCGINGKNADFGGATLDSAGSYLVKLNGATGNVQWARVVGHTKVNVATQPDGVYVVSVAATPTDVYVSGNTIDNDDLDGIPLQNGHLAQSAFVARLTPGSFGVPGVITAVWQCVPTDTVSRSGAGDVRVTAAGEVVMIGGYQGVARFGGEPSAPLHTGQPSPYGYEFFLTRITPSATGGSSQAVLEDMPVLSGLALDAQANCYITGFVPQGAHIGNQVAGDSGVYAARVDRLLRTTDVRWLNIAPSPQRAPTMFVDVALHPASGQFYAVGELAVPSIQFGAFTLTSPANQIGGMLVSYDTTGVVRWARGFASAPNGVQWPMSMGVDAAGRVYVAGWNSDATDLSYDGLPIRGSSSYLMRVDPAAEINGTVYLDANGNGQRDTGEGAFPRPVAVQNVANPTAGTWLSGSNGLYHALLPPGTYALEAAAPAHYTVSAPASNRQQATLTGIGHIVGGRDFGVKPTPNQKDVRVTLTPFSNARQGFANRYRVRVENLGTVAIPTGQVTVQFDAALQYSGAQPAPTRYTTTMATWNFQNLAPFSVLNFDVAGSLPVSVSLGTAIRSTASVMVNNDLDLTNNVDTVRQTVVGSFDPNDLMVNYTSLTPAQMAAGTALDYTVRFQNLGTDTAFTVTIQDTLPAHLLRLGTLQVVSQSHNCWWNILDNNHLMVRFDHANLPPQSTSVLNSMGFVRFQVMPKATLAPGALIPNVAHIVFDYNAPVTTNEVQTLLLAPNGLVAAAEAATWSLYPNPASAAEAATLVAEVPQAGTVTVRLVDALGRVAYQQQQTAAAGPLTQRLDLRALAPGFYTVRLALPDGSATSRKLLVGQR